MKGFSKNNKTNTRIFLKLPKRKKGETKEEWAERMARATLRVLRNTSKK